MVYLDTQLKRLRFEIREMKKCYAHVRTNIQIHIQLNKATFCLTEEKRIELTRSEDNQINWNGAYEKNKVAQNRVE